jgi:putative acetyltransferase
MSMQLESPDQPEVLQLIDELDNYQKALYPPESHHGIGLPALMHPDVLFAVARNGAGKAVGCGAVVLRSEYGEIKRMFVSPSARGTGIGKQLLTFLEDCAKAKGCTRFVLETGYLQPEALALYLRSGYVRCGPFGSYAADPNSVFMQKNGRR